MLIGAQMVAATKLGVRELINFSKLPPEALNADPSRFVEMKFMAELKRNGYFDELNRRYPSARN